MLSWEQLYHHKWATCYQVQSLSTGGFAWGQRRAQHFMKLFAMTLAGVLQHQFTNTFWQMSFRYV